MNWTLSTYISKRVINTLFLILGAAITLVLIGDIVELARRAGRADATDAPLLTMALLHAPSVVSSALPFIFLLTGLVTFLRLARSSELVVTRAVGISAWRLLAFPVGITTILGIGAFTVYNPISAAALRQFDYLEGYYLQGQESLLSISPEGLWLRQPNESGQTVIRADRATPMGEFLLGLTLYEFDAETVLTRRIEAPRAALGAGQLILFEAQIFTLAQDASAQTLTATQSEQLSIPTTLTADRILSGFATPNALSFWALPDFIERLDTSGFSSARYRLFFQTELARPILFSAMLMIGAGFAMRSTRFGGTGLRVLGCIVTGFIFFFILDIAQALGASGTIPVYVAAWAPSFAALFVALALLLHLEDG